MLLSRLLCVRPGVTALTGGGGKTAAMYRLARELRREGTVICTTTTRILPPDHLPVADGGAELAAALARLGCVCAGAPAEEGKLGAPGLPVAALAALADYVLVEADGSAGRPMKAHAPHEPVIPAEANQTVLVIGASGFGQPIFQAAHRPERYAALAGVSLDAEVTPEIAAAVIDAEGFADRVLVNQVETAEQIAAARRLEELLACPVLSSAPKGEGV